MRAWNTLIDRHGVVEPVVWLFRENLCLGSDESCARAGVTLLLQTFSPPIRPSTARAVYEIASTHEPFLRIELLAVMPGSAYATLRSDCGFVSGIERRPDWGLALQYEPSYHAVARIDSADEWRAAIPSSESDAAPLASVIHCLPKPNGFRNRRPERLRSPSRNH